SDTKTKGTTGSDLSLLKKVKAQAGNNLATLYLDENYPRYSPQEAVKLFRKHVFAGKEPPATLDLFAYHYNFGCALELAGEKDKAREHFRSTVELRPQFAAGVHALWKSIGAAQAPGRFAEGNDLIRRLLNEGQYVLARDALYGLLDCWKDAQGVEAFLPSWPHYYAATAVDSEKYSLEQARPHAQALRKGTPLTPLAGEFDRMFLRTYFQPYVREQPLLLLQREHLAKHFPNWSHILDRVKAPGPRP